jgi:hypothetical protein
LQGTEYKTLLKLRGAVSQEGSTGEANQPKPDQNGRQKMSRHPNQAETEVSPERETPIPSWRLSTKSATLYSESVSITKGGYIQV